MALLQDSTGYYLEPTTGQYYTPYTAPVYSNPYTNMSIGQPAFSPMSMLGMNNRPSAPEGLMNFDGKQYVPFTGSAAGISQGKRSVVDALVGGRQPYQYNVPSLASMFPALQGQMQAPAPQGNAGANRFLGGLLGSMPTPVSSTTTQAPSTSGAGRFL